MADDVVCEVTIPGDPIPKGRPRHGRGGQTFTPARTAIAEEAIAYELLRGRRSRQPTAKPVVVRLVFRCATRRRCDIDNLAKLVLDAANDLVWEDDQQVERLEVDVLRGVDDPGTYIRITEGR